MAIRHFSLLLLLLVLATDKLFSQYEISRQQFNYTIYKWDASTKKAGDSVGVLPADTVIYPASREYENVGFTSVWVFTYNDQLVCLYDKGVQSEYKSSYERTGTSSGSGHIYQTGPRGGQYYINSKGNKVYKKK